MSVSKRIYEEYTGHLAKSGSRHPHTLDSERKTVTHADVRIIRTDDKTTKKVFGTRIQFRDTPDRGSGAPTANPDVCFAMIQTVGFASCAKEDYARVMVAINGLNRNSLQPLLWLDTDDGLLSCRSTVLIPEGSAWPLCLYYRFNVLNAIDRAVESLAPIVRFRDDLNAFFDSLQAQLASEPDGD